MDPRMSSHEIPARTDHSSFALAPRCAVIALEIEGRIAQSNRIRITQGTGSPQLTGCLNGVTIESIPLTQPPLGKMMKDSVVKTSAPGRIVCNTGTNLATIPSRQRVFVFITAHPCSHPLQL